MMAAAEFRESLSFGLLSDLSEDSFWKDAVEVAEREELQLKAASLLGTYPRKNIPQVRPPPLPTVVKLKRAGSKVVQGCDVYIGRRWSFGGWDLPQSPWANPYRIGRDGSREEVLRKYKKLILTRVDLLQKLPELGGKILGCFCSPEPCHGDVLVQLYRAVVMDDNRHATESARNAQNSEN